jgi:hypothetical protein
MSDAAGFAAMGVAETLVHTYDITQGLAVAWRPPEPLSRLIVDRLLPDSPQGQPTEILLWATGRADLTGHPRVSEWVWRAALPAPGERGDLIYAACGKVVRTYMRYRRCALVRHEAYE